MHINFGEETKREYTSSKMYSSGVECFEVYFHQAYTVTLTRLGR